MNRKVYSEIRKDKRQGRRKNEARILGKVILDTWRFILGYIAKYRWILFRGSFLLSFPDYAESGKDSAYLGSTKRKKPPPQRGQERQLKQCNSQAGDNRFSMTSATLSTDSVYEEKKCLLAKSGKGKDYRYGENSLIREFKLSYRTIQIVL